MLIDQTYLDQLDEINAKYETVLYYIDLPPIFPHQNKKSSAQNQSSSDSGQTEYSDMYFCVFDWLKKKGVEKIFKVKVNDMERPHMDSAIRKAIKGIVIDVWDWQKLDISSETIIQGAPDVTVLNLYWSGNGAVLQGWSCKYGLAKLPNVSIAQEIYR